MPHDCQHPSLSFDRRIDASSACVVAITASVASCGTDLAMSMQKDTTWIGICMMLNDRFSELASEAQLEERKCMCCIACWSPLPSLRASAAFHIEHARHLTGTTTPL